MRFLVTNCFRCWFTSAACRAPNLRQSSRKHHPTSLKPPSKQSCPGQPSQPLMVVSTIPVTACPRPAQVNHLLWTSASTKGHQRQRGSDGQGLDLLCASLACHKVLLGYQKNWGAKLLGIQKIREPRWSKKTSGSKIGHYPGHGDLSSRGDTTTKSWRDQQSIVENNPLRN